MNTRTLATAALGLWVITAAGVAYLFVKGQTTVASDHREAIVVQPAERDLVLMEMRTMLESVQGIVAGMAEEDLARVQTAARASGMAIAQDVPPALMAKLPLDFKQLGMGAHRGFDELSAAVEQEETPEMLMTRLGDQLARCVACHAKYRLEGAASPAGG